MAGKGELWVERHAPASEEGLVVHKKKVAEVREWLEEQRGSLGRPGVPRLLVVTGGWPRGAAAPCHLRRRTCTQNMQCQGRLRPAMFPSLA